VGGQQDRRATLLGASKLRVLVVDDLIEHSLVEPFRRAEGDYRIALQRTLAEH
jgi:hypothetical protein